MGIIFTPSIDFAYTPFISPPNEIARLVRIKNVISTIRLATVSLLKNRETIKTKKPTITPLTIPPSISPTTIIDGGVGETSISSIVLLKNLEVNITNATFEYEFVITASMINPGITNEIYGTPLTSPIREPRNDPKIRKYKTEVIIEGNNVCGQIRKIRIKSLLTRVYREINLPVISISFIRC